MKTKITFLLLVLQTSLSAQILNGGFETWETVSTNYQAYEDPSHWTTNNGHYPWGGANMTVTKIPNDQGFAVRIASDKLNTDETGPGRLSQEINLFNLNSLSYDLRCDSIYKLGACIVTLHDKDGMNLLYSDTITTVDTAFQHYELSIPLSWRNQYPIGILQFEAYGNIFGLEPQNDAYAIMVIDNVVADFTMNIPPICLSPSFLIYPNPTSDYLEVFSINLAAEPKFKIFGTDGICYKEGAYTEAINVSTLPSGWYQILLYSIQENRTASFYKN